MSEAASTEILRWIVFAPLLAAVLQAVLIAPLRRALPARASFVSSCGALGVSAVLSGLAFRELVLQPKGTRQLVDSVFTWMGAGVGDRTFAVDVAFQLDALSIVMVFVVIGVGLLTQVYGAGFMRSDPRDDRGFQRFFVYMNLFVAAMLCLVMADNLVLLFLGWEGVGLCSYLLIVFWFGDRKNEDAGRKAFLVNRVGDFGFLMGTLLLFWSLADAGAATLSLRGIEQGFGAIVDRSLAIPFLGVEMRLPTAIGLLFFIAACGKSAQMPFHAWLPDAVAAPTPVSALIHAATMVTAGVYLLCRLSFVYEASPAASLVVAWVGGTTALLAAIVATAQDDIEKVLAWSTISQLGFMFLAIGCGAWGAAMFHLVTHAFFKAALFMGAGVVILSLGQERDLKRMGGLRTGLWHTHLVVVAAALSLGGFPFFSGFLSRDEILGSIRAATTTPGNDVLYAMTILASGFTAFYISRWAFLAFYGGAGARRSRVELRDPGPLMMAPLYVLAALSVLAGFATLPQFWGDMIDIERSDSLRNFLGDTLPNAVRDTSSAVELRVVGTSLLASLVGWGAALWLYRYDSALRQRVLEQIPTLRSFVASRLRFDGLIDATVVRPLHWLADRVVFRAIDRGLIDRFAVEGAAKLVRGVADVGFRRAQTGLAQTYLAVMVASLLAIAGYLLR